MNYNYTSNTHTGGHPMKTFCVLCLGIIFGLLALQADAGAGKAVVKVVEETLERSDF